MTTSFPKDQRTDVTQRGATSNPVLSIRIPPSYRPIRPLPKRARGANQYYSQTQYTNLPPNSNMNSEAGPSKATHVQAIPFRILFQPQASVAEVPRCPSPPHLPRERSAQQPWLRSPNQPPAFTSFDREAVFNLPARFLRKKKLGPCLRTRDEVSVQTPIIRLTSIHQCSPQEPTSKLENHTAIEAPAIISVNDRTFTPSLVTPAHVRLERASASPLAACLMPFTASKTEMDGGGGVSVSEVAEAESGENDDGLEDHDYSNTNLRDNGLGLDHRPSPSASTASTTTTNSRTKDTDGDASDFDARQREGQSTIGASLEMTAERTTDEDMLNEELAVLDIQAIKDARGQRIGDMSISKNSEEKVELDSRLKEHCLILPPHVLTSHPTSRLEIGGANSLVGKRLEFIVVQSLEDGNGTASLEIVSLVRREAEDFVKVEGGKLLVIKKFRAREPGQSAALRVNALTQLNRECGTYARITEAPKDGKVGFMFIMTLEATITLFEREVEHPCLLMPLMFSDLAKLIDDSEEKIAHKEVRRILAQTAIGLATLHSIGVIHNDIKPANVFLDFRGNVKIGDFGLSFVNKKLAALSASEGYSKALIGTPGYMAPEKIARERYSYQVDYWSLGWMLYELVSDTGELIISFEKSADVQEWAAISKRPLDRQNFFKDEEFDQDTLGLLCGLVDPCPDTRMGIAEMLMHPFFRVDEHETEFSRVQERAMSQDEFYYPFDAFPRSMTRYISEPADGTTYKWINPYGAIGSQSSIME